MDLGPVLRGGELLARVTLLAAALSTAGCASANDNETRMLSQMGHDIDENTSNWGTLSGDAPQVQDMGAGRPPRPSAPVPPVVLAPSSSPVISPPGAPPPPLAPLVPPTEPPPGQIATPVLPVVHVQPTDVADDAPLRLTNADLAKLSSGTVKGPGDRSGEKSGAKPKAPKPASPDDGAAER